MDERRSALSQMNNQELRKKRAVADAHDTPSKRHKPMPNKKPGTILRMTLKNFMCHSQLDVKFDDSINFVIGRNGSGKSAILTALIVGLGAKANVTNRGSSMKGFVKAGETSATVSITLNNTGPFAYRKEVYGSTIEIVRHVTASGVSQYKVKSDKGEVISKSAREIQNVVCGLNIQVDNPICILNQDTSRNFLSSSDPKVKYNLFVRATRLDVLYNEYKQGNKRRLDSLEVCQKQQQLLAKVNKEVDELHRRIESHRNINKTKMELECLEGELLWARVVNAEIDVEKQRAVTEHLLSQSTKLEDIHNRGDEILKEIIDEVQRYSQKIQELKDTVESQEKSRQECNYEAKTLQKKMDERMHCKMALEREMSRKEMDKKNLQSEIDNFTNKMSDNEKMRLNNIRKMEELQEKVGSLKKMAATFQNEKFQFDGDAKAKIEELRVAEKDLELAQSKVQQFKDNLQALRREKDNPLAAYGRNTVRLMQAVEAHKREFQQKPLGPLGSYVSVKDRKWTAAIEGFIGAGLLQAILVDNDSDRKVLLRLIDKYMPEIKKPLIITSKFFHQVHNVLPNLVKANDGCISMYEAISVSSPIVMNTLIDQLSIEGILLIENNDLAITLMSNGHNVPDKCTQGVTQKGDKYFPYPNYRTYCSRYHQARFLQVDREDLIKRLEGDITLYAKKREEMLTILRTTKDEVMQKRKRTTELQSKMDSCQSEIRESQRKLTELQQSCDEIVVGNVQEFENELKELQNVIESLAEKKGKIEESMVQVQAQIDINNEKLQQLGRANAALEERIHPIHEKIRELFNRKNELKSTKEQSRRRMQEAKRKHDEAAARLTDLEQIVTRSTAEAASAFERPDDVRTIPVVGAKIKELESLIRRMESESGDLEELVAEYQKKKSTRNKTKEILDQIHQDLEQLTAAYYHRRRLCKDTREYFETYISHCFGKFLNWRQFKGNLTINFEEGTLDMVVIPQHGSQGLTQTTNLSGGERSFSTVAFLYSLWQCLDFPFYFLDEFDVFMDKMNRARVMEILIHHAKSNTETQYIFLTPQDVAFLRDNSSVALHRLEDPERRRISATQ